MGRESINQLDQVLKHDYDELIKQQVESAISVLDTQYKLYESGKISLEEAKKNAANILGAMRYGENGYFWADTYEGINVVAADKSIEGKSRINDVDSKGFKLIEKIIEVGKQEYGGYTEYYFPKKGETEPLLKKGYSLKYEPFQWVIGTGNYVDDILKEIEKENMKITSDIQYVVRNTIVVSIILIIISMLVWRKIAKAISTIQGHLISHPSTISQWAGFGALSLCENETNEMINIYEYRKNATVLKLKEISEISYIIPEGAFYIFIDISNLKTKFNCTDSFSVEFCNILLNKYKVAAVPGIAFGMDDYIRISYACNIEEVLEGIHRLQLFINDLYC